MYKRASLFVVGKEMLTILYLGVFFSLFIIKHRQLTKCQLAMQLTSTKQSERVVLILDNLATETRSTTVNKFSTKSTISDFFFFDNVT